MGTRDGSDDDVEGSGASSGALPKGGAHENKSRTREKRRRAWMKSDRRTALHQAVYGDSAEVRALISGGANVNARDIDGDTPLHSAAHSGNRSAIEILIHAGANVNAADRNRNTPLHYAASGDAEVIRTLLKLGAKPDVQNVNGITPLHWAAFSGNVKGVKALLAAGATCDKRDVRQRTPEAVARECGHAAIGEILRAAAKGRGDQGP
ncbi:MAG: hypothetical protein BroJett003_01540 [Planctomycetota bacterium]|nr:MAG: hypothetical protein BroJett003_01540 [Planctomycetota bacterium]